MKKIKKITIPHSNLRVYLFGSVLHSSHPNDVDLLIQYDNLTSPKTMLKFRKDLKSYYAVNHYVHLHISLLTDFELQETNFLSKVEYLEIEL